MGHIAFTRRALMGAAALVGAGTVTGCSSLPVPTWLGGGPAGITGMLDRLDPASFLDDDRVTLHATWTRPQAAAEALEVDPSADRREESIPMERLSSLMTILPDALRLGFQEPPIDPVDMLTTEFLLTPEETISLSGHPSIVHLWTGGADLLDEIEQTFTGVYARDGDVLRLAPEVGEGRGAPPPVLIAPLGEDLVLTTEDDTSRIDTEGSSLDRFEFLPELVEAIGLEEAHLQSAFRLVGPEGIDHAPEWVWATRFDSPEEHTSVGALKVEGDAPAYCEQLLADEEMYFRESPFSRSRIVEAEVDGQIIHVTFANDIPEDPSMAGDVLELHRGKSSNGGPLTGPLGY